MTFYKILCGDIKIMILSQSSAKYYMLIYKLKDHFDDNI